MTQTIGNYLTSSMKSPETSEFNSKRNSVAHSALDCNVKRNEIRKGYVYHRLIK